MFFNLRNLVRSSAGQAVSLALLAFAGAQLGQWLSLSQLPLAVFWPPSGILIAALLLQDRRRWPICLAITVAACFCSEVSLQQRHWSIGLGLCLADACAALFAAALLRLQHPGGFAFNTFRQILDFLLSAAVVGPAVGALLGAAVLTAAVPGQDFLQVAVAGWMSSALGVVIVGSLGIAWANDRPAMPQPGLTPRALLGLVLGIGIVWGICAREGGAKLALAYPLIFLPLPAYVAIIFSRKTALSMVLLVACLAIYRTLDGSGVIAQLCETPLERAMCLQLFLGATSLSALMVATIVEERRIAQGESRESLQLLRQANQELENRVAERTHCLEQTTAELLEKRNLLAHAARISTAGELAAGIAHELNQPLYAINNYASGLQRCLNDGEGGVNVHEVLSDLRHETQRAAGILKRLRQFVQGTASKPERICLGKVIDDAIQLNRHELRQKGIEVTLEVPADLPPVQGDAIQLQQVLVNLMRNAVESLVLLPSDQRRLTIGVIARGGCLRTQVQDTGAGFPQQDEGRLFDPFYTTKPDGMGIGLTISRSIVEAHGGMISASRCEPRGATFEFTLPLVQTPLKMPGRSPMHLVPEPHFTRTPAHRNHAPTDLSGR